MQANACDIYHVTVSPDGIYSFMTDGGVLYSARFFIASQFAGKVYSHCIYEFTFDADSHARHDCRVIATIADILRNFFAYTDNIFFYLCDSSDGRHYARKRLFDNWFITYSLGRYIQYDANIIKLEYNIEYLMNTISHCRCPFNDSLRSDIPEFAQVFSSCK